MDINWKGLDTEQRKILESLGFKEPKKKRKKKKKDWLNLKDNGVMIKLQRNIYCSCCKTTTVEYVDSFVHKKLIKKHPKTITDSIRNCKKCKEVLGRKSKDELIRLLMTAHRCFTYN